MKSLATMTREVRENNIAKGWRDEERSFGDMIALLHAEASEALEAYRDWKFDDMTGLAADDCGIIIGNYAGTKFIPKPEGVGSELADVLIRLLDMADLYGFDIEAEYERKMAYNRTRPYRHGGRTL